jgi:hypothetical protein
MLARIESTPRQKLFCKNGKNQLNAQNGLSFFYHHLPLLTFFLHASLSKTPGLYVFLWLSNTNKKKHQKATLICTFLWLNPFFLHSAMMAVVLYTLATIEIQLEAAVAISTAKQWQ